MALTFQTTTCPACEGDRMHDSDPHGEACRRCRGEGVVLECTVCLGKGWTTRPSVQHGSPYIDRIDCEHCDKTGAEPAGGDDAV